MVTIVRAGRLQNRSLVRHSVIALIVAASLAFAASALAQVTARVDRDRLVEGETLSLVLQTNDTRQSLEADFSALEGDFMVLDQRSETQMSIVNGQQSAVMRKMITLEPLRSGRLVIPSLKVGNHQTDPISVTVEAAPEPTPGQPEPVFIEVALNPESGPYYVHAQVGLVVRLFYQQSLTEAAISQPEPENAAVRLLDEVPFQAERGGQRYRVLERRYAVFPERSGEMVIPPLVLSGRLVDRSSTRLWSPSSRGRRVRVESESVTLEILPRPVEFSGTDWQPARSYRLGESLSTDGAVRVGEPVTRTITIDAVGLEENMIAEPQWGDIANARIYPDQPQGISRDDGEWVLGHKEFRYAVVPEGEGNLVLPELKVAWWDTVANQERISILPSRTVEVLPSLLAETAAPQAPVSAEMSGQAPGGPQVVLGGYWRWLTLLFAALWLATLAWALTRGGSRARVAAPQQEAGENEITAEFRQACRSGDAAAARLALRRWLRDYAPVPEGVRDSLIDFARFCRDESLAGAVRELDAAGFSPSAETQWNGKALYAAWHAWMDAAGKTKDKKSGSLTDLYAPGNRAKVRA